MLCFVGLLLTLAGPARPVATETASHTRLTLVSETAAIKPDGTLNLGLLFDLDPHWHIYWINPGDSGEPPRVKWDLPQGFRAGELEWPAPQRLTNGPLTDYGYQDRVLLIVPVRAPSKVPERRVKFSADVRWLVCSDICIPAKASVSLDLPVQGTTKPQADSRDAGLFRTTRRSLAQAMPAEWRESVEDQGDAFAIRLRAAAKIQQASFFPLQTNQVENAKPQKLATLPDGIELVVHKSDQLLKPIRELRGVLVIDGKRAYQMTAAVQHRGS